MDRHCDQGGSQHPEHNSSSSSQEEEGKRAERDDSVLVCKGDLMTYNISLHAALTQSELSPKKVSFLSLFLLAAVVAATPDRTITMNSMGEEMRQYTTSPRKIIT